MTGKRKSKPREEEEEIKEAEDSAIASLPREVEETLVASLPRDNEDENQLSEEESKPRKKRKKGDVDDDVNKPKPMTVANFFRKDRAAESGLKPASVSAETPISEESKIKIEQDEEEVALVEALSIPAAASIPWEPKKTTTVHRAPSFEDLMMYVETQSREERDRVVREAVAMAAIGLRM